MSINQTWLSPAKLNLFLYITGRRDDGYHNLQTLFQFIDYADTLHFRPRNDDHICLLTPFNDVNHDDNLIIRSALKLREYANRIGINSSTLFGVDITIDKKLPMGAGLGGGSSNAATTLVALNHLWNLKLPKEDLMALGRQIGADVPIFIFGHSALAQGIGDELIPIVVAEKWYLIVVPAIHISTAQVFNSAGLKRDTVTKLKGELLSQPFSNDCEPMVRTMYPQIDTLIQCLSSQVPTRLTGTGAAIFCECENEDHAKRLQKFLQQSHNVNDGVKSVITKGINQSPLAS